MKSYIVLTILCSSLLLLSTGCDRTVEEEDKSDSSPAAAEETQLHSLHNWWCVEHGVPEHECGKCRPKLRAEYREKGDWCKKHNRPQPQCFKCDPKLAEPYTKKYVARYGKQPPPWKD
ncbi:MAG: RND transporter [Planctomycetes bacterium]|nr:RND transporter [Planctomycetota bacterium]